VYSVGPPWPADDDGQGGPVRVSRASRRAFDGWSASALDPMLRVYLSDMVRPYGLVLRDDLLDLGSGHSYGEMAAALLPEAVPANQPIDLIVFAFAIPDVVPGRSTASYLSHLCPGHPMAFAVCDQGAAAPFTGLRLTREYLRTGSCQRVLLIVAEQSTVHYDCAPADVPARHTAVTLLCGQSGPGHTETVRQHADVAPGQAGDLLAADIGALSGGRPDVTLLVGNGLARVAGLDAPAGARAPATTALTAGGLALPAGAEVLIAPPGQPCTGVWWQLAGGLDGWAADGRRVLLADYEPLLRYLCVAAIDIEGSPAVTRPMHTACPGQLAQ
jgi:4-hydroxymandelate oxidase